MVLTLLLLHELGAISRIRRRRHCVRMYNRFLSLIWFRAARPFLYIPVIRRASQELKESEKRAFFDSFNSSPDGTAMLMRCRNLERQPFEELSKLCTFLGPSETPQLFYFTMVIIYFSRPYIFDIVGFISEVKPTGLWQARLCVFHLAPRGIWKPAQDYLTWPYMFWDWGQYSMTI